MNNVETLEREIKVAIDKFEKAEPSLRVGTMHVFHTSFGIQVDIDLHTYTYVGEESDHDE